MRTDCLPFRYLITSLWFIAFIAPVFAADSPPPLDKEWQFDTIKLKNGSVFKGLILEENETAVRFQHVRRSVGRPTVSMTVNLRRSEIDKIQKLPEAEHELLKSRLKELDPSGEGERKRMETLELKAIDWNGKSNGARRYDSDHFSLISDAPDDIVRRTAVRLEQIYTAYVHFLRPRFPGGKPTTIILYPSLEDYQAMLEKRGWKLQNPAFFEPASNRIVCGSNLLKLGNDLEKIRRENTEQRLELDRREAELRRLYGKKPTELARHMQQVLENRRIIAQAERYNDAIFDGATKRLFSILYHEAFHAYACNFVYPPAGKDARPENPSSELPCWLNEGLAQIFETAIVESGELRVGHADKERLLRVKEALKKNELMTVKELLAINSKAFLIQHNDDRIASDRAYLASWALALYLTFDRRLLGSNQLDAFVAACKRDTSVDDHFSRLVGQKIPDFESDFHAWLLKLKDDRAIFEPLSGKER